MRALETVVGRGEVEMAVAVEVCADEPARLAAPGLAGDGRAEAARAVARQQVHAEVAVPADEVEVAVLVEVADDDRAEQRAPELHGSRERPVAVAPHDRHKAALHEEVLLAVPVKVADDDA